MFNLSKCEKFPGVLAETIEKDFKNAWDEISCVEEKYEKYRNTQGALQFFKDNNKDLWDDMKNNPEIVKICKDFVASRLTEEMLDILEGFCSGKINISRNELMILPTQQMEALGATNG